MLVHVRHRGCVLDDLKSGYDGQQIGNGFGVAVAQNRYAPQA